MSTWKGRGGGNMSRIAILLAVVIGLGMTETRATPCSCAWRGPFLLVAKQTPLVIRGRILRWHVHPTPTMDVLVLETLFGGLLDSGLTVQMGDGMHCRPDLDTYPPGTEWILALNGPGSKPGKGWALSHCGEYSLRIDSDEVVGSINGMQGETQRMPLPEFRQRFLY